MDNRLDFEKYVAKYEELWLKQYDKAVKRNFPEPRIALKDVLINWVAVHPNKPHIIFNDRILTYDESNAIACKLANALLRLGDKKGDRISIILPNMPETVISFMACYKTGMIAVGYNPRSTEAEIKNNVNDSEAVTVIVSNKFADKVIHMFQEGETTVKNVIVIDYDNENRLENIYDFYELVNQEEDIEPNIEVYADDVQILLYTGGTTGVSKGCCHTNKGIIGHEYGWLNWYRPALEDSDIRVIMGLPMTHGYGINCGINWPLVAGGTVIILDSPATENIIDAMNKWEPTVWPAVPALINQIVYHPKVKDSKIWVLKMVVCGSAPLAVSTFQTFRKYTKAKVGEGFGMSEGINCTTFNRISDGGKPGSVGVPWPDTQVLIVDLEEGKAVMPPYEKGEIIWRGPQLLKEYWEKPEETAHAIRNGWLYSGDIGYMDEDGYFYIVDRKKDMIIVGGFNVYPREIDELLFKHPKIYASCTIGSPEPRLGEVAKSFVVVKPGEKITADEIIAYCRESLTAYKVPKLIEFIDEIPLTKNNKPDKEKLKRQERERLYGSLKKSELAL